MPPYSRNEDLANLFRRCISKSLEWYRQDYIDARIKSSTHALIYLLKIIILLLLHQRRSIQEMGNREKINAIYYHSAILHRR